MNKKCQFVIVIVEIIILLCLSGYRMYEYLNKDKEEIKENENSNSNNKEDEKDNISNKEQTNRKIKILVQQINIRKEANETSEDIGDVLLNETYEVLEEVDSTNYTWYKINKNGVIGYIANKKSENWIEVIYNGEELDSSLIKNLILPIKPFFGGLITDYNDIIKNDIIIENASNKDLLHITLQYMYVNGELFTKNNNGLLFIDFEKVNLYAKNIFGNDIELQAENIKVVSACMNTYINYSETDNGYWINESSCGGAVATTVFMDMISERKESNDIVIEYIVFLTSSNTSDINLPFVTRSIFVSDFRDGKEIDSVSLRINTDNDDSSSELDEMFSNKISELKTENKLPIYKATFKKQSDGNYYFSKGEWQ